MDKLDLQSGSSYRNMQRSYSRNRSSLKSKKVSKNKYWDVPIAKHEHVTNLIDHFLSISEDLEVFNKGNPRQIESRIKRLFRRLGLDEMEVNFLRGFLGGVEKKIHKKK